MTVKTLFVIKPQSIIDVITNSSSELFVFEGNSKEIIESLIKAFYPDYLFEYEELKSIEELDSYEIYHFLGWVYEESSYGTDYHYECIAPEGIDIKDITVISDNKWDFEWYKDGRKFSEEKIELHLQELKDSLKGTFLLYSLNENPNWDMQEKLELIGKRYHLG